MWEIKTSKKTAKQIQSLPAHVKKALTALVADIRVLGPVRGNWPNYSKLADGSHHCHLKNGHPTYVAIWKEIEGDELLVRITYAGTHENAPY